MKNATILKRNPTNTNHQKLLKSQRELNKTNQKEQLEYIQGQISNFVKDNCN